MVISLNESSGHLSLFKMPKPCDVKFMQFTTSYFVIGFLFVNVNMYLTFSVREIESEQ